MTPEIRGVSSRACRTSGCRQRRVRRDHAAVVTAEMEGRCKRLGEAAPIREDEVLPRRRPCFVTALGLLLVDASRQRTCAISAGVAEMTRFPFEAIEVIVNPIVVALLHPNEGKLPQVRNRLAVRTPHVNVGDERRPIVLQQACPGDETGLANRGLVDDDATDPLRQVEVLRSVVVVHHLKTEEGVGAGVQNRGVELVASVVSGQRLGHRDLDQGFVAASPKVIDELEIRTELVAAARPLCPGTRHASNDDRSGAGGPLPRRPRRGQSLSRRWSSTSVHDACSSHVALPSGEP